MIRISREPARPSEQAGGGDPLAELARLIGQSDPFAEFGRSNARQGQPAGAGCAEPTAPPDELATAFRRTSPTWLARFRAPGGVRGARGLRASVQPPRPAMTKCRSRPTIKTGTTTTGSTTPSNTVNALHGGDDADPYYQDDVPLEPHDDEMYDDAPHARRRSGLATALALIGCAVLGTAGAYAYRSYSGGPSSTQPPPVITADSSTPTKIVPATAGDPQSSKAMQDRLATVEKGTTRLQAGGAGSAFRSARHACGLQSVAGTGRACSTAVGSDQSPRRSAPSPYDPMEATRAASLPAWRRQRRRHRLRRRHPPRPDRPPRRLHPARRPRPRPAQRRRADLARTAGRRARRAAARRAPRPYRRPRESAASGFVVQLSSQKTESEAQSSFRSLQAKFPNELGSRQPIIRRADLGSKGVFYRTMVGPFASAQEASQFCANYKAAGGQCVVPNN